MIPHLPPEDRTLSPYTGYTRAHWAAIADHLLLSVRPYFNDTRSRVDLPGRESRAGVDSDALEGFARTFMLYAFRMRGEDGTDPNDFTSWYRDGLIAGTDPENPERWITGHDRHQVRVEAASIALGLQLTRPWLWDTLTPLQQRNIIDWLAICPGGLYSPNNWLWFRLLVESFLASVGGPHDTARMRDDLDSIESYYRTEGWYADGAWRAYDYYCGWAMHVYPLLWATSPGSEELGGAALESVFRGRLADFLDDYVHLIGADGVPLLQGRSLTYRFAAAAPLWMGALSGATRQRPGALRRAASGVLKAFVDRGAINDEGLLTLGLFDEYPDFAQEYSGPGSPYWASKGMIGLMLPADHPVWTAVEEPLPVERDDVRRVIRSAGWLVSGTVDDGIVRVINHGADHAYPGDRTEDSPLYARYGYSTATIPPGGGAEVLPPSDNAVVGVDSAGGVTRRTGFTRGLIGDDGIASYATSIDDAYWLDAEGAADGPSFATASIVRGACEVRVVRRIASPGGFDDAASVHLRMSGWPLAGAREADSATGAGSAVAALDGLNSALHLLHGEGSASVRIEPGASPLGDVLSVPAVDVSALDVGDIVITCVSLRSDAADAGEMPIVETTGSLPVQVVVRWPEGGVTAVALPG
ncbi:MULTISPECIES: DUF2264 domain-containing protein [unclassified Microbacterium]|uniref:DUF2264 domain-containing protein n=1 Tax=unclassified Microbacterium TaxID=2609290 RepID=UPI00137F0A28|nr:DUF2264 domain-containing protein [Microbacterium sp. MAH-37]